MSTASVFPDRVADAFEIAARLGYDGLEVVVSTDGAVRPDIEHPQAAVRLPPHARAGAARAVPADHPAGVGLTPGMGWAAGVERILLAGERSELGQPAAAAPIELFVATQDGDAESVRAAFALLHEARSAGLSSRMDLGGRSLKGQLGHANALGARYVAIIAGDGAALRDMQSGGQEDVPAEAVVHAVLRGLHDL